MRVLCKDYAIAIAYAKCEGRRLVFTSLNGIHYYTEDYYGENIARCALTDLVSNGYIRVNKLYIKQDF